MAKLLKNSQQQLRLEKFLIILLLLVPLALLGWQASREALGANPVETLTHETGVWALRILLLSLLLTPLRILFKWRKPLLHRRLLGLMAFFYACLHLAIYLVFDQELDFTDTLTDIGKRPYITVGFAAFLLLLPLAITSTTKMIKRLGIKRWAKLHQLVYVSAALVILHYLWLVKEDMTRPILYGGILGLLLAVRAYDFFKRRRVSNSALKTL